MSFAYHAYMTLQNDLELYQQRKQEIQSALDGNTGLIQSVDDSNKESIFYMLMFCLCVPQSKAILAGEAIDLLKKYNFYTKNLPKSVLLHIVKGRVRFQNIKINRIIEAKKTFFNIWPRLIEFFQEYKNSNHVAKSVLLVQIREYLLDSINGMGMKLASHFMRNIGLRGLAILDVHIINGLMKRGLISYDDANNHLTKSRYYGIEQVMFAYANSMGITVDELDFLLWSERTGYVFK